MSLKHSALVKVTFAIVLGWAAVVFGQGVEQPADHNYPFPEDAPSITAQGIVRGKNKVPIAGAKVVIRAQESFSFIWMPKYKDIIAQTSTDASGRFRFNRVQIPLHFIDTISNLTDHKAGAQIFVYAEGHGLTLTDLSNLSVSRDINITLEPQANVQGVVRDEWGYPLAGVEVYVSGITNARIQFDSGFGIPGDIGLWFTGMKIAATTDHVGNFRLLNIPQQKRVLLGFRRPESTYLGAFVDTEKGRAGKMHEVDDKSKICDVLRLPVDVKLSRQRVATVKIIGHESNQVSRGYLWETYNDANLPIAFERVESDGVVKIKIDQSGRYNFYYSPDFNAPTLGMGTQIEISDSETSPTAIIQLPQARELSGRVVSADSNKPISGAYVRYNQIITKNGKRDDIVAANSVAMTDRTGSFRIPVVPGDGELKLYKGYFGYTLPYTGGGGEARQPPLVLSIPVSGSIPNVEMRLSRALKIRGRILNEEGKPVAGAVIHGENVSKENGMTAIVSNSSGWFDVACLTPRRDLWLSAADRTGASWFHVKESIPHPTNRTRLFEVTLTLKPGIALIGQVLAENKPQAGIRVLLSRSPPSTDLVFPLSETTTDERGEYRLQGLAPGDRYSIEFTKEQPYFALPWEHPPPIDKPVIGKDEKRTEIRLPPTKIIPLNQALRGTVVDADGKPVENMRVFAHLITNQSLRESATESCPQTVTAHDGCFEFNRLPNVPMELVVDSSKLNNVRDRTNVKCRPTLNQQDIHIILNPISPKNDVEAQDVAAGRK